MKRFLPERLQSIRNERGLSVPQLATASGQKAHNISNAEAGRVKRPGYQFITDISSALGVSDDYFFTTSDVSIQQSA